MLMIPVMQRVSVEKAYIQDTRRKKRMSMGTQKKIYNRYITKILARELDLHPKSFIEFLFNIKM
jgi:hypothetical protein